jgi:hypothetical protein
MANTPTLPHETNAIIAHALNDAINGVIEGGPPPSVLQPRQLFMGLPQQENTRNTAYPPLQPPATQPMEQNLVQVPVLKNNTDFLMQKRSLWQIHLYFYSWKELILPMVVSM